MPELNATQYLDQIYDGLDDKEKLDLEIAKISVGLAMVQWAAHEMITEPDRRRYIKKEQLPFLKNLKDFCGNGWRRIMGKAVTKAEAPLIEHAGYYDNLIRVANMMPYEMRDSFMANVEVLAVECIQHYHKVMENEKKTEA